MGFSNTLMEVTLTARKDDCLWQLDPKSALYYELMRMLISTSTKAFGSTNIQIRSNFVTKASMHEVIQKRWSKWCSLDGVFGA